MSLPISTTTNQNVTVSNSSQSIQTASLGTSCTCLDGLPSQIPDCHIPEDVDSHKQITHPLPLSSSSHNETGDPSLLHLNSKNFQLDSLQSSTPQQLQSQSPVMQELSSLEHQGEVTNSHTHLYTRPNQQETLSHSTENVASQPLCGAMDACPASGLHGQLVVDLPISNSSNLTSTKPTKKVPTAVINIG